jgi:hypothetical protein
VKNYEIVEKAIGYLKTDGWMRGNGWYHGQSGPLCAEGALMKAMGIKAKDGCCTGASDRGIQTLHASSVYRELLQMINEEGPMSYRLSYPGWSRAYYPAMFIWNDSTSSVDEIIGIFQRYVNREKAKCGEKLSLVEKAKAVLHSLPLYPVEAGFTAEDEPKPVLDIVDIPAPKVYKLVA